MPDAKKSSFLEIALIAALLYLGTQFALKTFFPQYFDKGYKTGVILEAVDASVKGGHHPVLMLRNRTEKDLVLQDRCPMPPVEVFRVEAGTAPEGTVPSGEMLIPLVTEETVLPCVPLTTVAAGHDAQIDLGPWKYSLFSDVGIYEVRLVLGGKTDMKETKKSEEAQEFVSTRFSIHPAGPPTQLFRTFVSKPMLNFLVFTASILPDHNLGIAIVVLTLIVKLLLFFPSQHALEGQRKMQALQPKLDAIREKHKGDPQLLQKETVKLWKDHGVNPFQSCLPIFIQFPILIGLFYVIRDGSVLVLSRHLLYAPYEHLSWTFGMDFLWLDLTKPDYYVFPVLLVAMQFLQMKMAFARAKRKKEEKEKEGPDSAKATAGKKKEEKKPTSQADMQQKMMLYGLPLMVGFFAFQFPAAVSLYWGVSTLFAIGQQWVVNRKVD